MNISILEKKQCSGCSACMFVCTKKAISMERDDEGFLYPLVNEKICNNCGLCLSACNSKSFFKHRVLTAYAAKNKNQNVLIQSSSGGVSHALCLEVINNGGVAYGVSYENLFNVVTKRCDTIIDCECFYGSKYVQTDPRDSFSSVCNDLLAGKKVVYFGTSCLVAGLLAFLDIKKIRTDNLWTVDLICHGVPSPKLFKEYVQWINKDANVKQFQFRTKKLPWGYGSRNYGCSICYDNGHEEVDTAKARAFLTLFFSDFCLRPNCYYCDFAGISKPSDLTIADYWGCKEEEPDFFEETGVSAILIHTKKGDDLIKGASELVLKETTVEKIKRKQLNLDTPTKLPKQRYVFWDDYNSYGFNRIIRKYGGYNIKGRIKRSKMYKKYLDLKKRTIK